MKIDFSGFTFREKRLIRKIFAAAAKYSGLPEAEVSVSCFDMQTMAALNEKHRHVTGATDVLSFPALELSPDELSNLAETGNGEGFPNLGDIAVCREIMSAQAEEFGHGEKRELAFLALHGLLHLLGYDHGDGAGAARMERAAEEILAGCGITRKN